MQKMKKNKRRSWQRYLSVAAVFIILIILILCITAGIRGRQKSSVSAKSTVSVSRDPEVDKGAENQKKEKVEEKNTSKPQTSSRESYITFDSTQLHTGDLILVNSKYAYDFDANAKSIDLVTIKDAQTFSYPVDKDDFQVSSRVMDQMDKMIQACDDAVGTDTHKTSISSAYRSKEYQQNVWDEAVKTNGEEYAKKYVAVPGYSEHHTGLAVDFGITNTDGSAGSFSGSQNAQWMDENSWRYGFVRRYPTDKVDITGISNESWHFRFVGVPHAKLMHEKGFVLEEYLDYLKNETSRSNPAVVTADQITYHIWYTSDSKIKKPEHSYTVSGNNVDGYIITEAVS